MRLKAIVLIPRVDGEFHLDRAVVFKRYGGNLRLKPGVVKSTTYGDRGTGVVVALILDGPTRIDDDFGEATLLLTQSQYEAIGKAFRESDVQTHKLANRPKWGGTRPSVSPWLEHWM